MVPSDVLEHALRTGRHIVADLELEIARRRQAPAVVPEPDRAIPLDDYVDGAGNTCPGAATLLQMTRSYLERKPNYSRLGGFKDTDGHVKFMVSDIRKHQKRQRDAARVA